ncbi:hypothetical protein EV174_004415 [Coemansia sp. RSA 2320]|nr:hypothetical protein EV174_004415 [Coemansia sp. RSA 2320]
MRNTLQALETDAGGGSIRLPDSIEEYDSNCERIPALQTLASTGQDVMLPLPEDNGTSSLVSMISLLYWTLLFTLGALMLDSFLCQVAGKRVMGTVDKIAQLEVSIDDEKAGEDRDVRRGPPTRSANRDTANVSNTVGRFVRWYIEGPEELVSSGSSSMSGAAPRSLRARKSSTLRGSFRHIE